MVRPEGKIEAGDFDALSSTGVNNNVSKKDNNDGVDENIQGHRHDFEEMPMLGEGDFNPSPRTESQDHPENPQMSTEQKNEIKGAESEESIRDDEIGEDEARDYGDGYPSEEYHRGSRSTAHRRITSNDEPKPNLIVNYLPQSFTDKDFFNLFAPYGGMESIKIMRDSQTGYSFGYGFVNYIELQDAIDARNDLNGMQLGHKRIKVSFARPPSDDIKDTNLFVTGLPTTITEEDLEAMFTPFGVIVHLRVLRDRHTKVTRGVAFVRYETRTEACAAILEMNGMTPKGARDPIRVRLAQDHGKQKAAYLAGYQAALQMKGGGIRVPDVQYVHPEASFGLRARNPIIPHRGRPLTACVGPRPLTACVGEGIRVTTSASDPSLYWKGFLQGAREPRRPETSGGRNNERRASASTSLY